MSKPAMLGAEALGQRANHLVIVAAFARRLDQLGAEDEVLVAAAAIDIVVLKKGGRRQHHVRHLRGLGHELLVDADEQIVARKAALDLVLVGRNRHRIGVLDDQRREPARRPARLRVSPVKIAPMRDWSSMRTERSRTSSPSINVLSSWKMSALMWKAPPPSYCQAPVTAGMQLAACMLAAPLRERENP